MSTIGRTIGREARRIRRARLKSRRHYHWIASYESEYLHCISKATLIFRKYGRTPRGAAYDYLVSRGIK